MALNKSKGTNKSTKQSAKSSSKKKLTKTSLKTLKKAELVELALNMKLTRISGLKKDEIIERILQAGSQKKVSTTIKKQVKLNKDEKQTFTASKKFEVEDLGSLIEPIYPVDSENLPKDYGETKLVLLVRDPYWVFAYWEINDTLRRNLNIPRGHDKRLKLKMYDVTGGDTQNFLFDIYVNDYTNNWYVNLPQSDRTYMAELIVEDGGSERFVVKSNVVYSPRDRMSDSIDNEWMTSDWLKIYGASIGLRGEGLSEEEINRRLSQLNLSSLLLSNLPGSESVISSFPSSESVVKIVDEYSKNFWLNANCELIVYGATESDAEVKVKGECVKLNADGSFTLRFALPEGKHNIDIIGENKDKDMEKKIEFTISKETK